MSQENVELIQRQIAALNRGDWEGSIEGIDPAMEWIVAREHPAARTVRGLDELREYRADWDQMLEGLTFETEKIEDRDDLVVTVGHIRGTGSGQRGRDRCPDCVRVAVP